MPKGHSASVYDREFIEARDLLMMGPETTEEALEKLRLLPPTIGWASAIATLGAGLARENQHTDAGRRLLVEASGKIGLYFDYHGKELANLNYVQGLVFDYGKIVELQIEAEDPSEAQITAARLRPHLDIAGQATVPAMFGRQFQATVDLVEGLVSMLPLEKTQEIS